MVVGYHLLWTVYGWWLPNDPRGSMSKEVVALIPAERRPPEHPVWGGPGWKVFLNTRADMERIDRYVRMNPIKARRPAQEWTFMTQYDG